MRENDDIRKKFSLVVWGSAVSFSSMVRGRAPKALALSMFVKSGESSSQFRWFTIAKIEL